MQKIIITIDLNKIDKERINTKTYTNKAGEEITKKEYKMEVVPLKKKKLIKSGDTWELYKTHFICDNQTKEERKEGKEVNYIGEGVQFSAIKEPIYQKKEEPVEEEEDIDLEESLPF